MKLTFCGGAGEVTGANYLLESEGAKVLIDCGLIQGGTFCDPKNFEDFPYDPKTIDAVFVTHAHIDHTGRLPLLYKRNFKGTIYSTPPTKDFAEHLLIDSEGILRKEFLREKKPPLYSLSDINETLKLWKKISYHETLRVKNLIIEFFDAGHILGSSFISITSDSGKKVVFSGDLGNYSAPMIKDTEPIPAADYVLIESTYGNRLHGDFSKRKDELEDAIEETVKNNGVLLIPAFAMERTQELLYELNDLVEKGKIPRVPIFIDSPLAIRLTDVYKKFSQNPLYFDTEAISRLQGGDAIFDFPGLRTSLTVEQSKEINFIKPPKIIIAGSGMSNGGRIIFHEQLYLSDPRNAILFIGYQGKGTLGRSIQDGAKKAKIFGQSVDVNCKIKEISAYSAHADQAKLLGWIKPIRESIQKVFIVQGEEEEMIPLANKIKNEMTIDTLIPKEGESVVL